eukprot:GHVS01033048.1.p1 GENE.GHVS01033048.1~~GHVS01033048.1.p1  ORF type:complete len:292 (+),score=48.42 GHVS01033048.1:60-935(+)
MAVLSSSFSLLSITLLYLFLLFLLPTVSSRIRTFGTSKQTIRQTNIPAYNRLLLFTEHLGETRRPLLFHISLIRPLASSTSPPPRFALFASFPESSDTPIPFSRKFGAMVREGKLPSYTSTQQTALQKTVQLMTAVNRIQDELADTEVAGEAGGLAEPPPEIPTPSYLRGEAAKSFQQHQNKNKSVLPGYYGYAVGTPVVGDCANQLKDEALVKAVYKGTGHPLRIELNDACMDIDKDTLETYLIQAIWRGWAKANALLRDKHRQMHGILPTDKNSDDTTTTTSADNSTSS